MPSSSVFDCPSCKLRLHAVGRPAAYVSALFVAEVRLARWPLMCHDRVDGDEPTLTHDFLAVMLGVRRGGVTPALQNPEGAGHIGSRRGRVIVLRRDQLEAVANRAYDGRQAEYVRLIEGG
ncbi:helix-turn-helix domain-containing protein [Methylobacterium sp. J-068]|uniref:helix-turn-helix domain-containing protein n=1 Tax=Methylobacterium sp. J-068 TaxID=2836649 RepID=UPI001FB95308|nr:helix-turn-helix domain-containing protein [Methylobacterium sp. J-068]MCJ2037312.1 helix-turn-helix domain-containing protein [Methylobacterium sp. J-068]